MAESKIVTLKDTNGDIVYPVTTGEAMLMANGKTLDQAFDIAKTALQSDYSSTKSTLQSDYASTKSTLQSDFSTTKTQLLEYARGLSITFKDYGSCWNGGPTSKTIDVAVGETQFAQITLFEGCVLFSPQYRSDLGNGVTDDHSKYIIVTNADTYNIQEGSEYKLFSGILYHGSKSVIAQCTKGMVRIGMIIHRFAAADSQSES